VIRVTPDAQLRVNLVLAIDPGNTWELLRGPRRRRERKTLGEHQGFDYGQARVPWSCPLTTTKDLRSIVNLAVSVHIEDEKTVIGVRRSPSCADRLPRSIEIEEYTASDVGEVGAVPCEVEHKYGNGRDV
jgi:hypothetical protein